MPLTLRRPAVLLAGAALLAGCATPVTLSAGEAAPGPTCARIIQATPDELGGLERRTTTAQATTAWGDPPVTIRCGVTPPGPTTDRCLSVDQGDGTTVDWIQLEGGEETETGQGSWSFVTYGRVPAVEVVVPVEQVTGQATAFLVDLGSAVQLSPAERTCVGAGDVS